MAARNAAPAALMLIVLACSLVANVVLWRRKGVVAPPMKLSRAAPGATQGDVAAAVPTARRSRSFVRANECTKNLEVVERDIRNLERAMASQRELGGSYRGNRNFTLEATVRANLPRIEVGDVECRGEVCRISPARGQDVAFWKQALDWQTDGWLRRKRDALSLEAGALYFTVRDDGEAFGIEVLDQFIDLIVKSDVAARCEVAEAVNDELLLRARILPEYHADNRSGAAELAIDLHGGLVQSALGRCLAQQIAALVEGFRVPERVSAAIAEAIPLWPPDRLRSYLERRTR